MLFPFFTGGCAGLTHLCRSKGTFKVSFFVLILTVCRPMELLYHFAENCHVPRLIGKGDTHLAAGFDFGAGRGLLALGKAAACHFEVKAETL